MTAETHFKITQENHTAWLTLNRPEKRNTMGMAFFQELAGATAALDADPQVRVIILSADGKSFTAFMEKREPHFKGK